MSRATAIISVLKFVCEDAFKVKSKEYNKNKGFKFEAQKRGNARKETAESKKQ
jgi:hypothetical protein